MTNVVFTIESWSAWSPSKPQTSDWLEWANNRPFTSQSATPDVSMIPAMKRRRMSNLTKMAFATALDCVKDSKQQPNCVFASQHGELERTVKILNSLVADDDVSPTDFSLSVHNTALGLFTIHTGNNQPATTVAAGEDSFGYGLLEAALLLERFPETPVLLVYFDQPLPSPLSQLIEQETESVSVALMLTTKRTKSAKAEISMNFNYNGNGMSDSNSPVTDFLKFYLSNGDNGHANTKRMCWNWKKA